VIPSPRRELVGKSREKHCIFGSTLPSFLWVAKGLKERRLRNEILLNRAGAQPKRQRTDRARKDTDMRDDQRHAIPKELIVDESLVPTVSPSFGGKRPLEIRSMHHRGSSSLLIPWAFLPKFWINKETRFMKEMKVNSPALERIVIIIKPVCVGVSNLSRALCWLSSLSSQCCRSWIHHYNEGGRDSCQLRSVIADLQRLALRSFLGLLYSSKC
jgi:hypothetical protein